MLLGLNGGRRLYVFIPILLLVYPGLSINMVGCATIQLFKSAQSICQEAGIYPSEFNHRRRYTILFCLANNFISTAGYLIFEANSMHEYGMVFFNCTTELFCCMLFTILFWQMKNILNHIEKCERFIEKSEYEDRL